MVEATPEVAAALREECEGLQAGADGLRDLEAMMVMVMMMMMMMKCTPDPCSVGGSYAGGSWFCVGAVGPAEGWHAGQLHCGGTPICHLTLLLTRASSRRRVSPWKPSGIASGPVSPCGWQCS